MCHPDEKGLGGNVIGLELDKPYQYSCLSVRCQLRTLLQSMDNAPSRYHLVDTSEEGGNRVSDHR